ncbi:unnamed protein product [Effrenium voratum]|uniref:RING-type domain-containing protein n=1 Tax=Effrenium voratum TaxID=2562239 RepID=A0AA36II50_9DINO|nr:unnamed protein product [Effrenium voratum]|mmetsp:Transcript_58842/g.140135  ORF Transcript_58842/g.140135 Transcript_58842/m.140135 type:complete len:181 (-) Transcript_58842:246-788(-)
MASSECCICYEVGPQVRALRCKHPVCTECCRKMRGTSCPLCRQTIDPSLLLELRIVHSQKRAYSFDLALPILQQPGVPQFFSTEHYPAGLSQDFELCVPPAALRAVIQGLNLEIAFVDTKFSCCNGLGPMLARQKLLRAIEKQNAAWRLANIPCYLSLSPGWGISQSTLFVQWDPDRDVI